MTGAPEHTPLLYVGLHQPRMAPGQERAMLSLNALVHRKADFQPNDWILDSGAFTRITSGQGHLPLNEYARHIRRWSRCGDLQAAVAQDYMCEPFVLNITGMTVKQHQDLSTRNWLELRDLNPAAYADARDTGLLGRGVRPPHQGTLAPP